MGVGIDALKRQAEGLSALAAAVKFEWRGPCVCGIEEILTISRLVLKVKEVSVAVAVTYSLCKEKVGN